MSPSKKLDIDCTRQYVDENKDENNRNISNRYESNSDSKTNSLENVKPTIVENQLKMSYRPIKSRTQLFASESSVPSVFQKSQPTKPEPEVVLSKLILPETQSSHETSQKPLDTATPFKKVEPHLFVTPSLRPQSFCSATTKNSSNKTIKSLTCEKKEKPQAKILFTTPIARPPPGSLLESTPIEMNKSAATNIRKLSPIKELSSNKKETITINNVQYIIEKKIGSGGSSSVYLAHGKQSAKQYAIKLVKLYGEQQVIEGYLNETKLLAKLQGNVSVVSLFDYCHVPEQGILYMVMEKGESDLHKILQGYRTHIPLYTLMTYWHQMLQAVHYIHQNGVIHQDLKPANFLMIDGRLKLIDFGIASNIAIDSTSIIKFSQAGTFNYISPEALIDTSNVDSPSTFHQPRIRLSTKSDVSFLSKKTRWKKYQFFYFAGLVPWLYFLSLNLQENTIFTHQEHSTKNICVDKSWNSN